MGENSGIEWTTHTFNPWVGCAKVSAGCTNCYAADYDKRVGGVPISQRDPSNGLAPVSRWGVDAPRTRTSSAYWRQPLKWNRQAEKMGTRPRVFCASLADVFEDRADLAGWRDELWTLIAETPHLDWLLLTKRTGNIARMVPWSPGYMGPEGRRTTRAWANVWLGTTVENNDQTPRILQLLRVPAAVRFLSMEPLLEWVDMHRLEYAGLDWVIVGGESGPKARPFIIDWARHVVKWGRDLDVPIFVKQFGSNAGEYTADGMNSDELELKDHHGGDMAEWPEALRVRQFPNLRQKVTP